MRKYRKLNCDKMREKERLRSSKRRIAKVKVKGEDQEFSKAEIIVELPKVTIRRCMTSFCQLEGKETQVHGLTVYLCEKHQKETK